MDSVPAEAVLILMHRRAVMTHEITNTTSTMIRPITKLESDMQTSS